MTGKMFSFEISRTTSAHAATLFRFETDGARWSEWAKPLIVQSSWEQRGDPSRDAHFAVRRDPVPRPTTRNSRRTRLINA
jgi:hypothetical protein